VCSNNVPAKNLKEFVAYAKANPGKLSFGSSGPGGSPHLWGEWFKSVAGIQMTHVPYKGATPAALGVAAGEVPVAFQGLATVAGLARGGKLRLIGVATPTPLQQFPGVPTVSESGLPGFTFNSWFTIVAPAGTPKEIVDRLHAEIAKALADPGVRAKFAEQGLTIRGTTPEELGVATREQLARYAKLFKEAGISAE
jgi:tripartite-type tricarboxylate transporter receptor subunit TctC